MIDIIEESAGQIKGTFEHEYDNRNINLIFIEANECDERD